MIAKGPLYVSLAGLKNVQVASKTLLLGVSVRVFLKGTSIRISRQRKEDPLSPMWAGIIQSFDC